MPTIVHQGTTLAYEDRGAGKPAFVFVHGWACNRTFFAPQARTSPGGTGSCPSTCAGMGRVTSRGGRILSRRTQTISRI
jgi:pimeloyl-ACP methyl ester carboxylesterase